MAENGKLFLEKAKEEFYELVETAVEEVEELDKLQAMLWDFVQDKCRKSYHNGGGGKKKPLAKFRKTA